MFDSFVEILGIVLSLVLFFIGYRQTVGAKKERTTACNTEVAKIVVRRIVLESYTPTPADISRLIEGKARDFRVSEDDVLSEAQVMNAVYTRVVESDLIPAEQRNEIIARIVPSLSATEARPVEDTSADESARSVSGPSRSDVAVTLMALLASTVGAVVAGLPTLANLDTRYPTFFQTAVISGMASLAIITAWIIVNRLRSSQESFDTRGTEVEHYVKLEREVATVLRRLGATVRRTPAGTPGDYIAEYRGKRILIEVKTWPRHVPSRILSEQIQRLRDAGRTLDAAVVAVTRSPLQDISDALKASGVGFCTVRQLRNYITDIIDE